MKHYHIGSSYRFIELSFHPLCKMECAAVWRPVFVKQSTFLVDQLIELFQFSGLWLWSVKIKQQKNGILKKERIKHCSACDYVLINGSKILSGVLKKHIFWLDQSMWIQFQFRFFFLSTFVFTTSFPVWVISYRFLFSLFLSRFTAIFLIFFFSLWICLDT